VRYGLTVIAVLVVARGVDANEGEPTYRLSIDVDAPVLLIGAALASSFFFLSESGPPACAPVCDPANVNAFDRLAAGNYDATWGTVGDIATAGVLVLVPLTLVADEGAGPGLNDLLVVGEAALWASAIQVPISYAVERPRPRVYGESAPLDTRNDANAGRSFFSGHVANCVAVTVATARTFQRQNRPALAWTALTVGLAGSAFVGVARVAAGSHFPTDDLVGAAIGAGIGIAVPALHESGVRVTPLAVTRGGGLTFSGVL
jgi:membrane-associated phospholipid phosphatase